MKFFKVLIHDSAKHSGKKRARYRRRGRGQAAAGRSISE